MVKVGVGYDILKNTARDGDVLGGAKTLPVRIQEFVALPSKAANAQRTALRVPGPKGSMYPA